jgi:hypothetical protein
MAGTIRSNIGEAPLKWTFRAIAREFRLAENTVAKRFSEAKISPDTDGTYSTKQVEAGLFGDLAGQRLAELRERTLNWQLKNRALQAELLDREAITHAFEQLFICFKGAIESTSMSRAEKSHTLSVLADWPVVVTDVAAQQVKQLPVEKEKAPGNGDGEEEGSDSPPESHTSGQRVKARQKRS